MMYRLLVFITAVLVAAAPALAQDHANQKADMENFRLLVEEEAQELSVKYPQDSDIINLVERVMMVRLAQTLGLTVEETQNLGTRVGQCRTQVYNLKWLRADLRQSLREAIEAGDEEAVEERLDKLLKLEVTISQLIEKMIRDSQSDLTVEQAAKFYLFIEDFEDELSRMIDKAQQLTREKADGARTESTASNQPPEQP